MDRRPAIRRAVLGGAVRRANHSEVDRRRYRDVASRAVLRLNHQVPNTRSVTSEFHARVDKFWMTLAPNVHAFVGRCFEREPNSSEHSRRTTSKQSARRRFDQRNGRAWAYSLLLPYA
jgi:hypothetical protein